MRIKFYVDQGMKEGDNKVFRFIELICIYFTDVLNSTLNLSKS